ncbi:MAG: methylenetetrahydrofolate reductase [Hyphomicrobiaceae bacterium]|nr:methylenetetrahydrofolate reductase [Hyphomicrobiaceae bacterium]
MTAIPASPSPAPGTGMRQRRAEQELLAGTSIEMAARRRQDAARIAALLPANTPVYINHMPSTSLDDIADAAVAVREAGLEPVPHLAARRIASASALDAALLRLCGEAGVQRLLILAGDCDTAAGPYADALSLLAAPLARHGIREVGLAGYPEGHRSIASDALERALAAKVARAREVGLAPYVVTQFSFALPRIVNYCAQLRARFPGLPVYVGVPGPTSPLRLLKFAQTCGVNASLRALHAQGFGAIKLVTNTDPTDQLAAVAQHLHGATSNVVGLHVYSFGGVEAAAGWIHREILS